MKKRIASSRAVLFSIVAAVMLTVACGLTSTVLSTGTPPPIEPPAASPQAALGNSTSDLARATVQILALVQAGGSYQPVWSGSGSIIAPQGLILTNSHVVDDRSGEYEVLGVALTERTDQPPTLTYLAEIAAVDYGVDLAVIRLISDLDGNPVTPTLPFIQLADSDQIEIGDGLRILGYPGIGGETITFTEGAVSGFTSERGVEGRAWIKTDATIAGGNSGGMGVNADGLLMGVPTRASAGGDNAIVDCRAVADTNRDGVIDDQDSCVPIGGFINGLRPSNLAQPLINAALNGEQYAVGPGPLNVPPGSMDLTQVDFSNLVFSDEVAPGDVPGNLWYALPEGTKQLCAFWDYEGMVDGLTWSAYWFANGELDEGGSFLNDTWEGGERGNWWVCVTSESGLDGGLYELALEVDGEVLLTDSIFVGGNRGVVDFTLDNRSGLEVCFVQLSPSDAQNWGPDELGSDEILGDGSVHIFQTASGTYDLKLSDCDGATLLEEYGLDLSTDGAYSFTG
ncbi:MAG TPA: serine protease [Anaerolineales bacterium]|nr:serine protease [Anaerolineales bacterium]